MIAIVFYTSGVPPQGIRVYLPCFVKYRRAKNIGSSGREIASSMQ
jgi:hypothetical protein